MSTPRYLSFILIGFGLLAASWTAGNLTAQNSLIRISEVKFLGNQSIPASQLKSLLRRSREGGRYDGQILNVDLQRVRDAYLERGFLHVEVGPPDVRIQGAGEAKAAVITIPVEEGKQYHVGKIAVRNGRALSPDSLIQMSPLKEGDPYSRNKISRWRDAIEEAYREIGYMRAQCSEQEAIHNAAGSVDCTMQCEEGKPYIVGKITLVGDKSVDPLQFKRKLLLGERRLFNPEMLALSVQYINKMNVYKPISSSDIQMEIHDDTGTVDITFRVFLADREK